MTNDAANPIAAGIDLGGTKSELRIFNASWECIHLERTQTPQTYSTLLDLLEAQLQHAIDRNIPFGIGTAGLFRADGTILSPNMIANGHRLTRDIQARIGRNFPIINDASALALSEAVFGAGKGARKVISLVIGTGVGGGEVINGELSANVSGVGTEYGHIPIPAHLAHSCDLPLLRCGCGRMACFEPYLSGPGFAKWASSRIGQSLTTFDLASQIGQSEQVDDAWAIWHKLLTQLLLSLTHTSDPDCFVIGGGMSNIDGLIPRINQSLSDAQYPGFTVPDVFLAEAGDASGARGAAYDAWQKGACA